jgi:predicted PurR-regulated permease PerM
MQKRGLNSPPVSPVITAVIVIAALYFGQTIFIPFALALLFSFLLTPPVTWLEKLRVTRALSVVLILLITFSAVGGLLWLGTQELSAIVVRLPQYQANIRQKLKTFRSPGKTGLAKAEASIDQITAELKANSPTNEKNGKPSQAQPVPVEVVKPQQRGILGALSLFSTSAAHFFLEAGAVLILTLFILMKRGDLRNRLVRLFGQGHLVLMTTALDDAARGVSRYLLTQSLVNSTYGASLGFGLYWIGLPYAAFWGVLAAILRFIPYAGTAVAGLCPFVLSLAVFSGWKQPLLTLGLFAAIEGLTTGVIEPWLYAVRTGISSLAILLSAAFWTLLWGPIGLVVSTPLTVCLVVLGRNVPHLEFLYVLLGDEPVLSPEVRLYQRLLAMDEDEAAEVAEACSKEKTICETYDSVLIPALGLAEQDRHQDRLDPERASFILQTTRELIEELNAHSEVASDTTGSTPFPQISIVCLPARDEADELACLMLANVLRKAGYRADVLQAGSAEHTLAQLPAHPMHLVFVSALPPFAIIHARSLCRKIRRMYPDLKIVLGLWNSAIPAETVKQRLGSVCSDYIVTTLEEAQSQLTAFATSVPAQKTEGG